ncbi:sugar transferase [Jeotgalibacillus campisalis]|uniref:Sugar transferase n=1 Tax=Jeotgalibacillus campisalis TaxID=220754 RepID=A0A0C2VIB2_9BACL|nr:sugar transferase [Jeotgalibacillus campisalis]KIL43748.1 sugar transferase [Jeotgalibacillus campisalis]
MKRLIDFLLSSILLIVLFPLAAVLGCLIFVKIGSPILFKQIRAGLHGIPFTIYKFRTMKDALSASGELLSDQDRLTPFGQFLRKYSLDELPQLVNVWKGEMSFVGPRPLLMEYLPLYTHEQAMRLNIKPGLTGWAQVNGRNAISWEKKFELDVWYVEHYSLWLDVKIIWMTVMRVVRPKGVSYPDSATVKRFKGTGSEESTK